MKQPTSPFLALLVLLGLRGAFGQCNNSTHTNLEIRFDFVPPHGYSQYDHFRVEGAAQDYFDVSAPFEETYELCAPRDECLVMKIWGAKPDDFTVRLDGESVPPGLWSPDDRSYHGTTTTEIGPCVPECQDDQQLLEVLYFSGFDDLTNEFIVYAQTDEVTKEHNIALECRRYEGSDLCAGNDYEYHFYRTCVDTKTFCHHFVSFDEFYAGHKSPEGEPAGWHYYNVSLDGNQMLHVEASTFNSEPIGTACENTNNFDNTVCGDDELLVELFIHRDFYDHLTGYPDLEYSFHNTKDDAAVLKGVIPGNATRNLQYRNQCVPKDACLLFNAGVSPEAAELIDRDGVVDEYRERGNVRVTLDGILFVDRYYRMGDWAPVRYDLGNIYVGNNCLEDDVCSVGDEGGSVVQVEMNLSQVKDVHAFEHCFWRVDHPNNTKYALSGQNFGRHHPTGHTFRHVFCLTPESCQYLELGCTEEPPEGTEFKVTLDGIPVMEEGECSNRECDLYGTVVGWRYLLAGCPPPFSSGEIAAIVVGSLAGLMLILAGILRYRRKSKLNAEFDRSPAAADDTGTVVSEAVNP